MSTPTRTPPLPYDSGPPPTLLTRVGAALRLLRERTWILALLGVIVLSVIFVLLGRWQFDRHEERSGRNDLVTQNYTAAPVPLSSLLPNLAQDPRSRLPAALEWRQATVTGTYLPESTLLLRNRPHNDQNGYQVVVPLRTTQGQVLYINRGWVPAGSRSAAEPDSVPAAPAGVVDLVVRMRPPEPPSSRQAPAGQANRLAVTELSTELAPADAAQVIGAFGLLVSETPPPAQALAAAARPDPGLGINYAYGVQWVSFAVTAYVLFGIGLAREAARRSGREPRPIRLPWRQRERDEYDEE